MAEKTDLSLKQRPSLRTQLTPKLWGRIKLSNFMELQEDDYRNFVRELETDPLFRRLAALENPDERIFSRRRFPGTDLVRNFCEINEETMAGASSPDLQPVLDKWRGLLPVIRKMGIDNFKRFFLYDETGLDMGDTVKACDLTPAQVASVRDLVTDLNVLDLAQPTSPGPLAALGGVKVAAVVPAPGEPGTFQIEFSSAHDARGCYAINYKKLYELNKQRKFSAEEWRRIQRLLKNAELVNTRQTALYRILKTLVTAQAGYFRTGKDEDLRPLTQQMLARELGVHRSTVNRTVAARFLQTPWGDVKPLKAFLANVKRCAQNYIGLLDPAARAALPGEELRRLLTERFGIVLADRTVRAYRQGVR